MTAPEVTGVLLAGGSSRRLGRDKALVRLAGKTLLESGVEKLAAVCGRVVVSVGSRRLALPPGVSAVSDRLPDRGPLAGLEAGLQAGEGGPALVLACDLPGMTIEVLEALVERHRELPSAGPSSDTSSLADAIVLRSGGRIQPLCGLYAVSCLPVVRACLDGNRLAVAAALDELGVLWLDVEPGAPLYHPRLLQNVNAPEDLAEDLLENPDSERNGSPGISRRDGEERLSAERVR